MLHGDHHDVVALELAHHSDGNEVAFDMTEVGARWPFAGDVHDVPEGEVVGRNIELCTFLGGTMWNCQVS